MTIEDDWEPRYNIAPGQQVPVIRQHPERPERIFSRVKWGLIPFWAKDAAIGYKMINARAETAAAKPAFRDALKKRRCLIVADGFYEWKKLDGKTKQPFCFTMANDALFAFAGIWDRWNNPEGKFVETCSILTTVPNRLLQDVHDRMPVILSPDAYDTWLDPGLNDVATVADLLKPFDSNLMKRYSVSTRVNSPKNDDPSCTEPQVIDIH